VHEPSFLRDNGISADVAVKSEHEHYQDLGKLTVYLAKAGELLGYVIFTDVIRPEVKKLFAGMEQRGIKKTIMLQH